MPADHFDRNLALEFVRVTEAAAIAAAKWIGRGDAHGADQAAVDEMRSRFNQIAFTGTVKIGEGEKDQAPELYTGEVVGKGGEPKMDLAVDPLEATDSVASGRPNAISVIAAGAPGSLLQAPDTYMEKIAVGPAGKSVIDLDAPVKENITTVAMALGKTLDELTVMVLDRERHEQLIKEIRAAGARVSLFTDGDVAAAIATCEPDSGVDLLLGIGGSTEAVLAAAAIKIMGGELFCRFKPKDETHEAKIKAAGFTDLDKIFHADDLARGRQLTFTATGVASGPLLQGVVFKPDRIITHSVVVRGSSGTLRYLTTHHDAFTVKA